MNAIRGLAPLTKFLLMLAFMACAYLAESAAAIAAIIALEFAVAFFAGVGRFFCKLILALSVGAVTLTLFQIFGITEGTTVFYLIPPLKWGRVTDQGLWISFVMSLRMMASVASVPLLMTVTPSTQIVSLVSGTFRLSPAYTCMLVTALRFIPTFGERMGMVLQAEAARGYRAETANPLRKIGMVLRLSLPLLVTCVRDVDSLALSLEARGFTPESKTRAQPIPLKGGEFGLIALGLGAAAALAVFRFAL